MFTRLLVRSTLVAALAAALLVPAAHADDWARDRRNLIDPAIAAAIHDRANLTPSPVALDPAIHAALLERASSTTPSVDRTGEGFQWSIVGVGAGATLAAALLALGSLLAVRHGRARVRNA